MYQCPKCKGWVAPHDDTYSHACVDTLQRIADKVAEHKELQDDPDYLLAKAAFTVIIELCPKPNDPARDRALKNLEVVNLHAFIKAYGATQHLTPRRRWQEKEKQ